MLVRPTTQEFLEKIFAKVYVNMCNNISYHFMNYSPEDITLDEYKEYLEEIKEFTIRNFIDVIYYQVTKEANIPYSDFVEIFIECSNEGFNYKYSECKVLRNWFENRLETYRKPKLRSQRLLDGYFRALKKGL